MSGNRAVQANRAIFGASIITSVGLLAIAAGLLADARMRSILFTVLGSVVFAGLVTVLIAPRVVNQSRPFRSKNMLVMPAISLAFLVGALFTR